MIFFCKFYQALINMLRIHRYLRLLGKPFQRLLHSLFYLVAYIQCSQTAFIFNRCPDAFISKKIGDQGLLCFIQLMRMPKTFHCLFHLKKIAAGTSQIVLDLCCKPCLSLLQSFFFQKLLIYMDGTYQHPILYQCISLFLLTDYRGFCIHLGKLCI